MNAIKKKYEALSQPILDSQYALIAGERAVDQAEIKDYKDTVGQEAAPEAQTHIGAIKEFWLKAMKNSDVLGEEIKECDEDALKSLKDVRVSKTFNGDKPESMVLTFNFNENPYFSNECLSKVFKLDDRDGNAVSSTGTEIEWKEGKNITKSTVKKQQKHKKSGEKRTVQKTVQQESFFHLFGSVDISEEILDTLKDQEIEESIERMDADWSIAENLDEEVIPFALEYYLNVIAKMPEGYDDEDESDDEDGDKHKNCKGKKHKH